MRSRDSFTEDIAVDHNRVARDYALMRLEYIKFSNASNWENTLEQINEDFTQAQTKLLSGLDHKTRKQEDKVTHVFKKLLKKTKDLLAGKSKKLTAENDENLPSPAGRLRRRLSVEDSENVNSPATPTKKKGGRLAAKPILDNIDENAPVSSPKPTRRKSVARDAPVDENPLTPARRSVRIRSNTSITSETLQGFDSPRAKRASRRNSLAGSDNESTVSTPVKQTRRTGKNAESSVEIIGETVQSNKPLTGEIIPEEPELKNTSNDSSTNENVSPNTSVRKSARLLSKTPKPIVDPKVTDKGLSAQKTKKTKKPKLDKSRDENDRSLSSEKPDLLNKINIITKDNKANGSKAIQPQNNSKRNLFNASDAESLANNSIIDKNAASDSTINTDNLNEIQNNVGHNTLISQASCESKDVTDAYEKNSDPIIDMFNKADKTPIKCIVVMDDSSSNSGSVNQDQDVGDQCVPISDNARAEKVSQSNSILASADLDIFQKKLQSLSTSTVITCEPMDIDETIQEYVTISELAESNKTATEDSLSTTNNKNKLSLSQSSTKLEDTPSKSKVAINTTIEVKESIDACEVENIKKINSSNIEEVNNSKKFKNTSTTEVSQSESPQPSAKSKRTPKNQLSLSNSSDESNQSVDQTKLDSSQFKSSPTENKHGSSKKKSLSQSQNLEKSSNENKSTLILSQLKDDETSLAKSPKISKQENDSSKVSKSPKLKNISNIQSSDDTPLKEKSIKNLGMQTSTPVVTENVSKNAKMRELITKKSNVSKYDKSKDTSDESDEDSDSGKSNLINDEAEDAGDDYESGDSQNEDERRYAEENEIVEKGETLDSEDEVSNETDYEKDSFVVSSAEEDNELLDGSEDDLNLSDNELTMSAKSKKKYDERKSKEQKKASREMFHARHKIKTLYESSSSDEEEYKPKKTNNRLRLDSSALSSEDAPVKSKRNRMRINSTMDESNSRKNIKNSAVDVDLPDENEITALCDKSSLNKIDPLKVDIKLEPKTPQRGLDMSIVNISTHLPIDEVHVNENASMVVNNETSDPLVNCDDDLNNIQGKSRVNKALDRNKKAISKSKETPKKRNKTIENNNEDSSDSIDLKMLFPDSDSEPDSPPVTTKKSQATVTHVVDDQHNKERGKKQRTRESSDSEDVVDGTYSLLHNLENYAEKQDMKVNTDILDVSDSSKKRTRTKSVTDNEGNEIFVENFTNIVEQANSNSSLDVLEQLESNATLSPKKYTLLQPVIIETTHQPLQDTPNPTSSKNKKQRTSVSFNESAEMSDINNSRNKVTADDVADTSITRKKIKIQESNVETETLKLTKNAPTSDKKKKKQRNSESNNSLNVEVDANTSKSTETAENCAINTSSLGNKKKKQSGKDLEVSITLSEMQNPPSSSKKKKQRNSVSDSSFTVEQVDANTSKNTEMVDDDAINTSLLANKKKKLSGKDLKLSNTLDDTPNPSSSSKKKKQRNSVSDNSFTVVEQVDANTSENTAIADDDAINTSLLANKKKKLSGEDLELSNTPDDTPNPSSSSKKKKLRNSVSNNSYTVVEQVDANTSENTATADDDAINTSLLANKKKKLSGEDLELSNTPDDTPNPSSSSKKKKLRNSVSNNSYTVVEQVDANTSENTATADDDDAINTSLLANKKKKLSGKDLELSNTPDDTQNLPSSSKKKKQRNSVSNNSFTVEQVDANTSKNTETADGDVTNTSLLENKKKKSGNDVELSNTLDDTQNPPISSKKKKQRNSVSKNEDNIENVNTSISKNGERENGAGNDSSLSAKKKKKSHLSESNLELSKTHDETQNPPISGKKKSKSVSLGEVSTEQSEADREINRSLTKKEKKKLALSFTEGKDKSSNLHIAQVITETDMNTNNESELKEVKKKKKKKSAENIEDNIDSQENQKPTENVTTEMVAPVSDGATYEAEVTTKSKKRKRGSSGTISTEIDSEGTSDERKKKMKLASDENTLHKDENVASDIIQSDVPQSTSHKKEKKIKKIKHSESEETHEDSTKHIKKNKKRKERDDDIEEIQDSKVLKENLQDNVHVPRLPSKLLQKLEDKSKSNNPSKKQKTVSTTNFIVEEGRRRKNKPSNYLEESVYLDADSPDKSKVGKIKKPKVLPFVPTASTSSYGFTSNFKVNILPTETKFVAQSSNVANFKNDYLYGNNIKRMGTYELYKKHRTLKLSKF